MDAMDRQVVLRKPSGGIIQILIRSRENIHSSLATTAIVASSLAGVCLVHEQPVFPSSVGVLLYISLMLQLPKRLSV